MKRRRLIIVLVAAAALLGGAVAFYLWSRRGVADDYLLRANARDLAGTVVTPHLEEPIVAGKNVLWCSTFQLAWNEACALIGEDVRLDDEPAMVAILNRKSATKADLDNESYVAMAGWTQKGILYDIRAALDAKFGADADVRLLPERLPPGLLVEYAYLFKDLRFAVPFERIEREVLFAGRPVKAFGLTYGSRAAQHEQLLVLHDEREVGEGDFVLELKTKSPDDRLILAKVRPEQTLAKTVEKVRALIAKPKEPTPGESALLVVPSLNFDLLRQYTELEGKHLKVTNPDVNGMPIMVAVQDVRFQLNEYGVRLRSEGLVIYKSAAPTGSYVFDRPFLILMERRGAAAPYFALWVDNAELVVPE